MNGSIFTTPLWQPNTLYNQLDFVTDNSNTFLPSFPYPNGEPIGTMTINSLLVTQDNFIQYTGDSLINTYILRSPSTFTNNYSCLSGFLKSYSCRYQVNQIPSITSEWGIANDLGNLSSGQLNTQQQADIQNIAAGIYLTGNTTAPNVGSITLSIDDFQTNRVQSFDIDIQCNKVPIYNMGNKYPVRIQLLNPINVTFSVSFEVGNYQFLDKLNFPQYIKTKDLIVSVSGAYNQGQISSYSFYGLSLFEENYNMSIDGNLNGTVVYKGFI